MKLVFVDTFFWTAFTNPQDAYHQQAIMLYQSLSHARLVTTDEVLVEFLNFFCLGGGYTRYGVTQRVRDILQDDQTQVVPQTRESFLAGLDLYSQRLDKGYSLTDCISMNTMWEMGIMEVLTHDRHFTQAGFAILFSSEA